MVKTSLEKSAECDKKIARFFYGCNIPFNVADNSLWKDMIETLRPGYSAPSRSILGGRLLDEIHKGLKEDISKEISGKDVTLMQDGWSDIHNSPVIATSVHTGTRSFFISSLETGANTKDAAYCTKVASDAFHTIKDEYNANVVAIVTDNENKMKAMRRQLQELHKDVIAYGCSSHYFNLLGQDMTVAAIVANVVEVQKYFRNHHTPNALLSAQPGSVKPQLPCQTRWNSQITCLKTYITNRPFMSVICNGDNEISPNIVALVNNQNLYQQVKDQIVLLEPVAKALDRSQADDCSIGESCHEWLTIRKIATESNDITASMKKQINKRFREAVTPMHMMAYMLDPRYLGGLLLPEEEEVAEQALRSKCDGLIPTFYKFCGKALPFAPSLFDLDTRMNISVTVWWNTAVRKAKGDDNVRKLADIAKLLGILPASSAAIERIFSRFSLVQTKIRNRLSIEKAAKLVLCYQNLRQTVSNDDEDEECHAED